MNTQESIIVRNGKSGRYVGATSEVRHIRLCHASEDCLHTVQSRLSHDPIERATASMVFRRAISLYKLQLDRMTPQDIRREFEAVRQTTHLPRNRRRKVAVKALA